MCVHVKQWFMAPHIFITQELALSSYLFDKKFLRHEIENIVSYIQEVY